MRPDPSTGSGRITRKQVVLIHLAKAQLGLSDEEYRALLMERYAGCFEGSSKELTYKEAEDLIEHFKGMGFEIRPKKRDRSRKRPARRNYDSGRVVKMVTPDQEAKITALAGEIPWKKRNGLEGFCVRMIGREWPATRGEAEVVIEALKGWIRGLKKHGADIRGERVSR